MIDAIEYGIADILTFNTGRRPLLTEDALWRLVFNRF